MNDSDTPAKVGSSEGLAALVEQLERAEFDAWAAKNGYGIDDDMLAPMDKSLKALLWGAWKARAAFQKPCRGVTRQGCGYLGVCGAVCNKCGQVH